MDGAIFANKTFPPGHASSVISSFVDRRRGHNDNNLFGPRKTCFAIIENCDNVLFLN